MHEIEDLLNWIGIMLFDRKWKGQEAEAREFLAARQLAREQLEAGIRDVFELPGRTRAILNQRHFRRP